MKLNVNKIQKIIPMGFKKEVDDRVLKFLNHVQTHVAAAVAFFNIFNVWVSWAASKSSP